MNKKIRFGSGAQAMGVGRQIRSNCMTELTYRLLLKAGVSQSSFTSKLPLINSRDRLDAILGLSDERNPVAKQDRWDARDILTAMTVHSKLLSVTEDARATATLFSEF